MHRAELQNTQVNYVNFTLTGGWRLLWSYNIAFCTDYIKPSESFKRTGHHFIKKAAAHDAGSLVRGMIRLQLLGSVVMEQQKRVERLKAC